MQSDEQRFRGELGLDQYNVVVGDDFSFDTMETKSCNIFNSRLTVASPNETRGRWLRLVLTAAVVGHAMSSFSIELPQLSG